MQTTLRIDDTIYREAKADSARRGITLTRYIGEAFRAFRQSNDPVESEAEERNRLMEALLRQTAHFRIGARPAREEMSER